MSQKNKYSNLDTWRPDPPAHARRSQRIIRRRVTWYQFKQSYSKILLPSLVIKLVIIVLALIWWWSS